MGSSFEDLEVWKKACGLSVRLYELLRSCRDYGMKDQMLRSSISVPSNIAEGSEKKHSGFQKVHKYCARFGRGTKNTGLYFTTG
jgi:four helix bundle protein